MTTNMAAKGEVVYEDYLYKLTGTKRWIFRFRRNPWRLKYFVLKKYGDKPVLEYHNKKPRNPKATPRGKIYLWPSFRVEKIVNTKNRAYVFEVTTPDKLLCLSADEQKTMDMFVFFIQIQLRLIDEIKDEVFLVEPENSETLRRIGAKGTSCIMHVSPYGVTLALQSTRNILAQWPLKCIRWYESSGRGEFTIEAGKIAPLGDGLYVFNTKQGDDNKLYDLLDRYVVDALGRIEPKQNTLEQIEDYVIETNRLQALTTVCACSQIHGEVPSILRVNWNHFVQTRMSLPIGAEVSVASLQSIVPYRDGLSPTESPLGVAAPPPLPNRRPTGPRKPHKYRIPAAANTASHSIPSPPTMPADYLQPVPAPPNPLRERGREDSGLGSPDNDPYLSMQVRSSRVSERGPASPLSADWLPPPDFIAVTASKRTESAATNDVPDGAYLQPESLQSPFELPSMPDNKSNVPEHRRKRRMRLRSQSCEDMSIFMRNRLYSSVSSNNEEPLETEDPEEDESKIPAPFARLMSLKRRLDWYPPERRNTYDYFKDDKKAKEPEKTDNSNPSLVKETTLRKSVSNPSFINMVTKEQRPSHASRSASQTPPPKAMSQSTSRLSSRSLVSLLDAAKRKFSREGTPESNESSSSTFVKTTRRLSMSGLRRSSREIQRQTSQQATSASNPNLFSGVSTTAKTRSFRRYKSRDDKLNQVKTNEAAKRKVSYGDIIDDSSFLESAL